MCAVSKKGTVDIYKKLFCNEQSLSELTLDVLCMLSFEFVVYASVRYLACIGNIRSGRSPCRTNMAPTMPHTEVDGAFVPIVPT